MKFDFSYRKDWIKPPWYSSYEKNNYGDFFYALMRIYQPKKVVELGTKAGYSAYHIARGLKANGRGTLACYDLWEKYEFNSVPCSFAQKNLKEFKNIISLNQRDAIGVEKKYKKIDILHVDLVNEGGMLEKIIPSWLDKVCQFIIILGGSAEHDNLPWMKQFKKIPVAKWLKDFCRRQKDIEYITVNPFPSVTLIQRGKNE